MDHSMLYTITPGKTTPLTLKIAATVWKYGVVFSTASFFQLDIGTAQVLKTEQSKVSNQQVVHLPHTKKSKY